MNSDKRWVMLIFLAALLVRLLFFSQLAATPYLQYPLVDADTFVRKALHIAFSSIWGEPRAFFHEPFYIYSLAAIFRFFGYNLLPAYLLNLILGAANAALTFILCRKLLPHHPVVAKVAGFSAVLCGPMLFFDGQLLRTTMATFFNLVMFIWFFTGYQRPRRFWGLLCGILLGLAALTRANILIFFPVAFVLLWRRPGRGWTALLWLIIGLALIIGPVTLRNMTMSERPVLISSGWGLNLYLGNNPQMDATLAIRPGFQWTDLYELPARETGVDLAFIERMDHFASKVETWVQNDPFSFIALQFKKGFRFFRGYEIMRNVDPYFVSRQVPILRFLLWRHGGLAFPNGLILPFALIGLWSLRDQWRRLAPWLALISLYAFSVVIFFVVGRYRVPLLPFLLPAAAFGLRTMVHSLRARQWTIAVTALLLVFILNYDFTGRDTIDLAEGYRQLGDIAIRAGQPEEAIGYYRQACTAQPKNPFFLNTLGALYHQLGDYAKAAPSYQQALAINPEFTYPRNNLEQMREDIENASNFLATVPADPSSTAALALVQQGLVDGVPEHILIPLLSYAARDPEVHPEAMLLLGEVCYRRGQYFGAELIATRELLRYPDSPELYLARGWARYGREDYRGAGDDWRQAKRLAPNHPDIADILELVQLHGG